MMINISFSSAAVAGAKKTSCDFVGGAHLCRLQLEYITQLPPSGVEYELVSPYKDPRFFVVVAIHPTQRRTLRVCKTSSYLVAVAVAAVQHIILAIELHELF